MEDLKVITIPDPILRQKAKKIVHFDDQLKQLVEKMSQIMRTQDGVGLAAPQVGKSIKLIVCEYQPREDEEADGDYQPFPLTVLVNPVITKYSKETNIFNEGCLSFPGLEIRITRPKEVNVLAQDIDGKKIKIRAKGLFARILQHEIDHLNGVLFPDYVKNIKDLNFYAPLKSVFLGTPEFAIPALEALVVNGLQVNAVITEPDKPAGRGQKLTPPAIKQIAEDYAIPVFQPEDKSELISIIKQIQPHYLVVAAYGRIIPKEILDMVPFGSLNIHPSMLPKYRGASPIQSVLLEGDEDTAVTIMLMDEKMDTGDIITQKRVPIIPSDNTDTLSDTLAIEGANLLVSTLPPYFCYRIQPDPQDNEKATYTKPIKKEDGLIEWTNPPEVIERQIRAYNPWPHAYTFINDKRLIIHEAHLENGKLIPDVVQLEGKNPTNWQDFLRGHAGEIPDVLK